MNSLKISSEFLMSDVGRKFDWKKMLPALAVMVNSATYLKTGTDKHPVKEWIVFATHENQGKWSKKLGVCRNTIKGRILRLAREEILFCHNNRGIYAINPYVVCTESKDKTLAAQHAFDIDLKKYKHSQRFKRTSGEDVQKIEAIIRSCKESEYINTTMHYNSVNLAGDYLAANDFCPSVDVLPTIAVLIQDLTTKNIGSDKYPIWEQFISATPTNMNAWAKLLHISDEQLESRLAYLVDNGYLIKHRKKYGLNANIVECGNRKEVVDAKKGFNTDRNRIKKAQRIAEQQAAIKRKEERKSRKAEAAKKDKKEETTK